MRDTAKEDGAAKRSPRLHRQLPGTTPAARKTEVLRAPPRGGSKNPPMPRARADSRLRPLFFFFSCRSSEHKKRGSSGRRQGLSDLAGSRGLQTPKSSFLWPPVYKSSACTRPCPDKLPCSLSVLSPASKLARPAGSSPGLLGGRGRRTVACLHPSASPPSFANSCPH